MAIFQFPPLGGMAVSRTYSLAKYWTRLGHDVKIVTPQKYIYMGDINFDPKDDYIDNADIVEVDFAKWLTRRFDINQEKTVKTQQKQKIYLNTIQKVIRKIRNNFIGNSFDFNFLWIENLYEISDNILKEEKYDLLFTSFSPQASFVVGSRLKKSYPDLFWVADYRDMWTQNHILKMNFLIKSYQKIKERKVLKDADIISTTSDSFAQALSHFHHRDMDEIVVITNGYDKEAFLKLDKKPFFNQDKTFRIVHVGTIYKDSRDPSPLFEAIKRLSNEKIIKKGDFEVIFYGDVGDLKEIIERYNIDEYVKIAGSLNKNDALRAQRDASSLLLLHSLDDDSLSARGMIPAKVYEYIYAKRYIFGVGFGGDNFTAALIQNSGAGDVYNNDSKAIYRDLLRLMKNDIKLKIDHDYIEKFSRENLSFAFMNIIQRRMDAKRSKAS